MVAGKKKKKKKVEEEEKEGRKGGFGGAFSILVPFLLRLLSSPASLPDRREEKAEQK